MYGPGAGLAPAEGDRVLVVGRAVAPGAVRISVAGPVGCPARGWPASVG